MRVYRRGRLDRTLRSGSVVRRASDPETRCTVVNIGGEFWLYPHSQESRIRLADAGPLVQIVRRPCTCARSAWCPTCGGRGYAVALEPLILGA